MDTLNLTAASSTPVGTFQVLPNGSITVYAGSIAAYNTGQLYVSGHNGFPITSADKSFRINYRSKDGTDKTETVSAITLENAKSMIKDLDRVNYHIEG